MLDKLDRIIKTHEELQKKLADPSTLEDPEKIHQLGSQLSELDPLVEKIKLYHELLHNIEGNEELLETEKDPEMRQLAKEELAEMKEGLPSLEEEIRILLLPKDPRDSKNVIMEIRAGTGGQEAGLFAGELLRMYLRYADGQGWQTEILSKQESGIGGIKEAIVKIDGQGVFSRLKFESGTHRVQRIPETESGGRIHTSAVTVAILPEAQEVDLVIDPNDLKIDIYRSSGPGGQSVNTTDSAVRITHEPTGLVVSCQDERSQLKNRQRAMSILRSRLYAFEQEKLAQERGDERRLQVGTGDRSQKIRTYNFPQDRVTDHRISLSLSNLPGIVDGSLDRLIDPLVMAHQADLLTLQEGKMDQGNQ